MIWCLEPSGLELDSQSRTKELGVWQFVTATLCHGRVHWQNCCSCMYTTRNRCHLGETWSWRGRSQKMQVICSWKCFGWYNNDPSLEVMLVHAWLYHETLWYFRVFYCMVMSFRPRCQVRRRNSLWKRSCAESAHDRWIQAPHHADVYCIMQYRVEYY